MKKMLILLCLLILKMQTCRTESISIFEKYSLLIPKTYRAGFLNLDQEFIENNLNVIGNLPEWLSGTLYINGPAKFTAGNSYVTDWFDGLAMIHAFKFNKGKVSYRNKFLKTDDYDYFNKTGKFSRDGFFEDPFGVSYQFFSSAYNYAKQALNLSEKILNRPNANVAIVNYSGHLIALTETPSPIEFNPQTLETIGGFKYNDNYPESGIHDTAHLHYDYERKEHLGYFTEFGFNSYLNLFRIKDNSTKREVIASIKFKEPSYMHSFAITKRYAILTALPMVINPLKLLLTDAKNFFNNFKWKPELGTQLIVIDRISNRIIGSYKTEPFFAWHTVNAYEDGDSIILDISAYPDNSVINLCFFDNFFAPENEQVSFQGARIKRYTINLKMESVSIKQITNEQVDMPTINYLHNNAKDYKYLYGMADTNPASASVQDKLVKINVKTEEVKNWHQELCYPSEPIFVSSANAKDEDDGVILSVVFDAKNEKSFLLVLDGYTFTEKARILLNHHIPYQFHGLFLDHN